MIPDLEEADIEMQNSLIYLVKRLAPQSNLLIKNPQHYPPPPRRCLLPPEALRDARNLPEMMSRADALRAEIDGGDGLDGRRATRRAGGADPKRGGWGDYADGESPPGEMRSKAEPDLTFHLHGGRCRGVGVRHLGGSGLPCFCWGGNKTRRCH